MAMASKNPLIVLSYTTIFGLWLGSQYIEIPYVIHLMTLVTAILYAACHLSLCLREEQAEARGEESPYDENGNLKTESEGDGGDKKEGEEEEEEEVYAQYETLRTTDAMQFPLLGSCSLFGLYLAFKYFDKDTVNLIISVYFCLVGLAALTATFGPVLESVGPKFLSMRITKFVKVKHPLPEAIGGKSPWKIGLDCTVADIIAFMGSGWFCVVYFQTKKWMMNNVLGICFCLQGIERFSLGTYKTGAILLVGLFFYDIFWVFGTEVMVTVAKSLDGPIKILFPRNLTPHPDSGKLEMSLLGLGDIVIPGFFLALLLRFDAHLAKVPVFPTDLHVAFPKPYFHSGLLGYVLGLGTTLYVMIVFEAAQPALLYLVPACLGSSLLCATVRGELKELFDYSEEEEEVEEGEEKKDEVTKKNE